MLMKTILSSALMYALAAAIATLVVGVIKLLILVIRKEGGH